MTDLAYDDTGAGTPLVFLHGITSRRESWTPVVDRLSAKYRCVNVDLLGHGESPRTGAYDVFSQSAAVEGLITDLGLDAPVLIGHSFGAFVATLTAGTGTSRGVVNIDQELDMAAFKTKVAPYADRLREGDFAVAFDEFTESLGRALVPQQNRDLTAMTADQEVVLGVWTTVFDTPAADLNALIEPALETIAVPYLVIFASKISQDERRLLELIPRVEVEEWEGMGHFLHLVDPERTTTRISAFVDQLR
ncbi:MAG: alpha/beta hydrolase [Microthrixaceae bacterium]|nr:alpha/beta hydrolase [Microthrixaceae bacterium]